MSRRLRRGTAGPRGDAGFGLAEMVVAMGLTGIVLLGLGTTFAGTLKSTSKATTRVSDTAELRLAMDVVARRLRFAVRPPGSTSAFEIADPRQVRFYASLHKPGATAEQPPTLVEYRITVTCLEEVRTTPTGSTPETWSWTDPAAPRTTTCLARGTVNPASAALFTYYADPVAATAPAALDQIRSVAVTASVQTRAQVAPVAARTRVTLPNLLPTP